MNFTIDAPQATDKEGWQSLYRGYAEFYKMPMNSEILDTVWSWIQDPDNAFYCLLAKDQQEQCIGLMHYRAMPSPLRGTNVGFLDDLFISDNHRGAGLAQALFEQLEQQAKHHNWPAVRWITAEDNHRAKAVYEKLANKTHWLTYQLNC